MKMNPLSSTFCVMGLLLFLSTSCQKDVRNETAEDNLSASVKHTDESMSSVITEAKKTAQTDLLQALNQSTSRFHSTTQAIKAGYMPDDHCVSVPGLGGMGYHWVNPTLVDAEFDPLAPEAILYASGPGGKLRLVAVEYIVINAGQTAPMFASQPFDVGGTPVPAPHWSLHVWLYEKNPSGLFTPFNPNISCP